MRRRAEPLQNADEIRVLGEQDRIRLPRRMEDFLILCAGKPQLANVGGFTSKCLCNPGRKLRRQMLVQPQDHARTGWSTRREALRRIALANGAVDKIGGGRNYEMLIRPAQYRWLEWIARCTTQGVGALAALDALSWPADAAIDQAQITTGCMIAYVKLTAPELMPPGRYPALDALSARLDARPEFQATSVTVYAVPRG